MKTVPLLIGDFLATYFRSTFYVDTVEVVAVAQGETPRYKLISCENMGYGYVGGKAIKGGVSYSIKVIGANYLIVESATVLVKGEYSINLPSYLHGTQSAVSAEITQLKKSNISYPFIFLHEILGGRGIVDKKSRIGEVAEVHIWFLLDTKDGVTKDIHEAYITPMHRLMKSFIKQIGGCPFFGEPTSDYQWHNHALVGTSSDTAYLKNFFTTPMAGVELRLSLPVEGEYCSC